MITPISNKYEKAGKIVHQEDMHMKPKEQLEPDNVQADKNQAKPRRPPPPIVIHGLFKDHKTLNNFLTSRLKEKFHWKHSAHTTILQVNSYEDWVIANKNFETGKIEYHTYTPKQEKTHAFVLRGLYHEVDIQQLKEELVIEYEIPVKDIYTMKGTRFQTFLVITANDITLKQLEQKVRYLDYTVVRWERHNNSKKIIQCHKCQMWGHATSNCHASPRCLKCAQSHLTNQCTKNREDPAKCVNCGEAHTANSVACTVYQDKIWQLERKNTRMSPPPEMKYVAAPAPPKNAWEERRNSQQQQTQQSQRSQMQESNFPPLPQRRAQMRTSGMTSQPAAASRPLVGPDAMNELQNQFRRVEALMDIELMTTRVRLLADQLETCQSESEKFQVFYNFMLNIDRNAP